MQWSQSLVVMSVMCICTVLSWQSVTSPIMKWYSGADSTLWKPFSPVSPPRHAAGWHCCLTTCWMQSLLMKCTFLVSSNQGLRSNQCLKLINFVISHARACCILAMQQGQSSQIKIKPALCCMLSHAGGGTVLNWPLEICYWCMQSAKQVTTEVFQFVNSRYDALLSTCVAGQQTVQVSGECWQTSCRDRSCEMWQVWPWLLSSVPLQHWP